MIAQRQSPIPAHWRGPIIMVLLAVGGMLLLFQQTSWSLVDIWLNAETYNHGFIILPIALWLVWEKRKTLAPLTPRPALLALPLFAASGLAWAVGYLVGVQVVAQLGLIAMLITGLWSLLGHVVSRMIAFPLLFLFLAVPMGQGLVPPMMEFTASFTVTLLELTGIPVYREGMFFSLPSGNWSVVEACSGVRYIIASVTLGLLFAYLSYTSLWRRALFVLISFLVPILANGVRAYLIVMIGHLSGMKLAVGVDHLIYGWIFFGLVMLLLFWIGSWWSEPVAQAHQPTMTDMTPQPPAKWAFPGLLLLVMAVGIQGGATALASLSGGSIKDFVLPAGNNGWVAEDSKAWPWQPATHGEAQRQLRFYDKSGDRVALFIALYPAQTQGHEAVSSFNHVVDPEKREWRILRQDMAIARLDNTPLKVNAFDVAKHPNLLMGATDNHELKVWQWYQLGERKTANPYVAKLYEMWNRIYHGRADGAYIAIATEQDWTSPNRQALLQAFIDDMMPLVEQSMAVTLGRD